jgi:hypothetical protein
MTTQKLSSITQADRGNHSGVLGNKCWYVRDFQDSRRVFLGTWHDLNGPSTEVVQYERCGPASGSGDDKDNDQFVLSPRESAVNQAQPSLRDASGTAMAPFATTSHVNPHTSAKLHKFSSAQQTSDRGATLLAHD